MDKVKHWKERLRDYFTHPTTPAHKWFEPWRTGLKLLGVSYEDGTATHLDVSYRPTRAMLRNKDTVPKEFRRMVERDAAWFFKLLLLCPNLRLLLTYLVHDADTPGEKGVTTRVVKNLQAHRAALLEQLRQQS